MEAHKDLSETYLESHVSFLATCQIFTSVWNRNYRYVVIMALFIII